MSPELAELWADKDTPASDQAVPLELLTKWTKFGGDELEGPLQGGWVKLVRASWLIDLDKHGGVLRQCQDLPRKACIGLDELTAAGPSCPYPSSEYEWLRIIVLSYPWLQPGHPDRYGESLHVVAKVLRNHTTLQALSLTNTNVGVEGAAAWAEALRCNSALQNLDLSANNLDDRGAAALAEGLRINVTLQSLNLWGNAVGAQGAAALAEALRNNSTIQQFDLRANDIGAEGRAVLAEALAAGRVKF